MRELLEAWDFAASPVTQWDAYMRGLLVLEIVKVKKNQSGHREELEKQVQELEEKYVHNPTDPAREAWQWGQSAYERLLSSIAEKKQFFSKLAFFEEG